MTWTEVADYSYPDGWVAGADGDERSRAYCRALEEGRIVYFPAIPFNFPTEDREFLLSQKQSGFKGHKNVSYRPVTDVLRGSESESPEAAAKLHDVMRRYSKQVTGFLAKFLEPYAKHWKLDFASFRPLEEQGRDLSLHKRNDLMHVDAFPSRPTHGGRILRVFTNVNPSRGRVWETTDGFEKVVESFADGAGLKRMAASTNGPTAAVRKALAPLLKRAGFRGADRSVYDKFMLRFHDFLKENADYQQRWTKYRLEFPPGSTWMVYTDQVPHAVLSGQYAVEQTFIVPIGAMVAPELSPVRVLERYAGAALV